MQPERNQLHSLGRAMSEESLSTMGSHYSNTSNYNNFASERVPSVAVS